MGWPCTLNLMTRLQRLIVFSIHHAFTHQCLLLLIWKPYPAPFPLSYYVWCLNLIYALGNNNKGDFNSAHLPHKVGIQGAFFNNTFLERGSLIWVAECLKQTVPNKWASVRKRSLTQCFWSLGLQSMSFGLCSVAGLLDSAVWPVFWNLQCGRSFGLYSVAGLLDSIVRHVFRTLQCGRSFRLYSMAGLLDSTVC